MLAITTPFVDGLFFGILIGIAITVIGFYLVTRDIYSKADTGKAPIKERPIPKNEYMEDFEELSYHKKY